MPVLAVGLVEMGRQYFFNTLQTGGGADFLLPAAAIRPLRFNSPTHCSQRTRVLADAAARLVYFPLVFVQLHQSSP